LQGGETFSFNGNVPNTSLITNLPENACVEVPVYVDKGGLHPVYVGPLPPQCLALTHINVVIEEMAVEAALTGNPRLVFQAIAHDPLTAAVLSLAEIKEMVNEMFQQHRDYLPQFEHLKV
jgi:alpha-galactosidase